MADISQPAPIGTILPTDKHGQQQKRRKEGQKREDPPLETADPHEVADVTDVMGIPVAEMTPKVQETLNLVMVEFDKARTELEHARAHILYLEELADRDPVLPLINRRGLHRELSRMVALTARAGVANSFVCFHILNIEDIRRGLGLEAAEAALVGAAETLIAGVRDTDVIGSLGGGDIGVILTIADDENATEKAADLARALQEQTIQWKQQSLILRVAHGLHAFIPGDSAETILEAADRNLLAHRYGGQGEPP